jgi:hypothetical protein
MKKTRFSPEEDILLTQMVNECGESNWKEISTKVNKTERQCSERFLNYLSPKLNKMPRTSDDDIFCFKNQRTRKRMGIDFNIVK